MNYLIGALKVFATIVLLICFLVGVWKADPRSHNPEYPALAEYTTGFIMCALAVSGFYYLWLS
jgi:hypothetical protein